MISSCSPTPGAASNSPPGRAAALAPAVGRTAGNRFGMTRSRHPGPSGFDPGARRAYRSGGVCASRPSQNGQASRSASHRACGFECDRAKGRSDRSGAKITHRPVTGSRRYSGARESVMRFFSRTGRPTVEGGIRPVVLEPLAEAGHVVGGVPEPAVELDDRGVRGPHLEVDLWAPLGPQPPLDLGHDRPAVALALVGRIDAEVVDPATVAVVPGHRRGDDRAGLDPDQEQVGPDGELAADVLARVVPRPG